ncbi:MAG TPA: OmpA family protein [Gemmatimonadaceae bacterium]|nr:OmpA family protein [Gemmatimonadaceae bacterium]
MSRPTALLAALLVAVAAPPKIARSQGFIDRVKQKAKDRLNAKADSAADKGLDKLEGAIRCVATDKACIKKAQDAGKPVVVTDAKGNPLTDQPYAQQAGAASAAPSSTGAPGTGLWVNYDFVPGDSVIFAEDFTRDDVGEFPKRLELVSGNYEVAQAADGRYLRGTAIGYVKIPLGRTLPDRFTFEADMQVSPGGYVKLYLADPDKTDGIGYVQFNPTESGVKSPGTESTSAPAEDVNNTVFHARVMADGKHVKVYVNDKRVANAPSVNLGRSNELWLGLPGDENNPVLITNIRVAASARKLYDALAAAGRVATHGILFDTGSDALRGESTPTLTEIGDMLRQHPDLDLTIEGHTDNVGDAASNQSLSERRAAAVKQYLVTNYQIDAGRLTAKGYGASKPTAPNTTPEGRQMNRRVELVKN